MLAAFVMAVAAHDADLATDEASKVDDASALADYPKLRATAEASYWEIFPWDVPAPGPWWRWEEVDGPQAAAVPQAAVGDAAPYLDEWDYSNRFTSPSVLPGAAGLEHWDEIAY